MRALAQPTASAFGCRQTRLHQGASRRCSTSQAYQPASQGVCRQAEGPPSTSGGPYACDDGRLVTHRQRLRAAAVAALVSLTVCMAPLDAMAVVAPSAPDIDTFENIPSQLGSGEAASVPLSSVVSGPKKKEIEGCTRKCVPTCIRGGDGAPGLGPISVRKEAVVFKQGFRSRGYCLSECAQVCALSLDKDKAALLLPQQQGQQAGQRQ